MEFGDTSHDNKTLANTLIVFSRPPASTFPVFGFMYVTLYRSAGDAIVGIQFYAKTAAGCSSCIVIGGDAV